MCHPVFIPVFSLDSKWCYHDNKFIWKSIVYVLKTNHNFGSNKQILQECIKSICYKMLAKGAEKKLLPTYRIHLVIYTLLPYWWRTLYDRFTHFFNEFKQEGGSNGARIQGHSGLCKVHYTRGYGNCDKVVACTFFNIGNRDYDVFSFYLFIIISKLFLFFF